MIDVGAFDIDHLSAVAIYTELPFVVVRNCNLGKSFDEVESLKNNDLIGSSD